MEDTTVRLGHQTTRELQTLPEDWDGVDALNGQEAERLAEMSARHRETTEQFSTLTPEQRQEKFEKNNKLLHGDEDFEGFDTPPETAATTGPTWDHETVEVGEDEPDPDPEPADNGDNKPAKIQTTKWAESGKALAAAEPYYQDKNGAPDWFHMTGAAGKLGFNPVTDDNLDLALDAMRTYAHEQQKKAEASKASD